MFDSNLITYAVSLHFTPDVNEIITTAVKSIAVVTGNSFIIENKIPPHVTIGAFHAAKEDETKLIQMVEEFTKSQKPGIIQFKEIGNFNGKVLFLKPEKDGFLSQINAELHSILLPEFEKAENGYYLPKIYFPHTTLATRLNHSQFEKAFKIAESINLPLDTEINEIAVFQCSPFAELKHLSLNS
jgi:2'-5' RNA ligase